ncbi:hypothetical protein AB1K70_11590 [Bremerella sp. JC770]|uniref:hypothetical protein n=1 Tax=Bremerella sp. JC770 TaxID=3232137 RepID=UPI0034576B84
METYHRSCLLVSALCLAALAGCSKTRPTIERYHVTGTVSLNGDPVDHGEILFTSPEDVASGNEGSGMIVDGKYDLMSTPGAKQVRIYASETIGKDQQGMNKIVDLIPPKYNRKTTLTVEIPPEEHVANFELQSNPNRRRRGPQNNSEK